MIYLDHAAATPVDDSVLEAMQPFLNQTFYNPSAIYSGGEEARSAVEAARARIARILGAQETEIYFTSGATESNNLAIKGFFEGVSPEVACSAIEHESVLASVNHLRGEIVEVDQKGRVNLESLSTVAKKDKLVSIIYANNEIGVVQDMTKLSKIIHEAGGYIHTDATQAANYLDLNVVRLGVDMMTLNSGKIYGPKGWAVFMSALNWVSSHYCTAEAKKVSSGHQPRM